MFSLVKLSHSNRVFQGRFSIDLTNTGLSLASEVTWKSYGHNLSKVINIKEVSGEMKSEKKLLNSYSTDPTDGRVFPPNLYIGLFVGKTNSNW